MTIHVAPAGTPLPGQDERPRWRRLVDRLLRRKPVQWTPVGHLFEDRVLLGWDGTHDGPISYWPDRERPRNEGTFWWIQDTWDRLRYEQRIQQDLDDTRTRVQLLFVDAWARYGWARPGGRPSTPTRPNGRGGKIITVKRCCNGCSRELGDATDAELLDAIAGLPLPDVRQECGCAEAVG